MIDLGDINFNMLATTISSGDIQVKAKPADMMLFEASWKQEELFQQLPSFRRKDWILLLLKKAEESHRNGFSADQSCRCSFHSIFFLIIIFVQGASKTNVW